MKQSAQVFESLSSDFGNLAAQMDLISVTQNQSLLKYELGLKTDYVRSTGKSLALAENVLTAGENPRAEEFRLRAL